MIDFIGQELTVGDDVVYLEHSRTSSWLRRGRISKITDKSVMIGNTRKSPEKIVKVGGGLNE